MRGLHLLWAVAPAGVLAAVIAIAALRPAREPTPAYACTGGPGPFQEYAVDAEVVVVAQAESVGGPENSAPTVTPTVSGNGTRIPTSEIPLQESGGLSLQGIGVSLRVIEAIGSVPVEIDVDMAARRAIEERLRQLEAEPNTIVPCPLDFGIDRYEEGKTYLLFLKRDQEGEWYTYVQWEFDGEDVLTGGAEYVAGRAALTVPRAVLDAYFLGVPAIYNNAPDGDPWAAWLIDLERVPLDAVLDSVWSLRTGRFPTPSPGAGSTPPPVNIAPPSVGDAGCGSPA